MNNFDNSLSNFISETTSGGQIRALARRGLSVKKICESLDFPTPYSKVQEIVWKFYLDEGIILEEDPEALNGEIKTVRYVREYNKYGKADFRRTEEIKKLPYETYVPCDFGKLKYKDPAAYEKKLQEYEPALREYIDCLPWPLKRVWHAVKDDLIIANNFFFI